MSKKIHMILSDSGVITAFANGKNYTVSRDHPNYDQIKAAIVADDATALEHLSNISKTITTFAQGRVKVKDGVVYFRDKEIHNVMTQRILTMVHEGFPFEPMVKFLDNVLDNPSSRAVNELFSFLSHQAMPITDDGHFLAYKRVKDDYKDFYSGTFDNTPGKVVEVERNTVDDNCHNTCSYGLHVGAISYVNGFNTGTGHVIVVKVNPKDCVSVPNDANGTKLRVCRYEVLHDYEGDLDAAPVYTAKGEPTKPTALQPVEQTCNYTSQSGYVPSPADQKVYRQFDDVQEEDEDEDDPYDYDADDYDDDDDDDDDYDDEVLPPRINPL